MSGDPSRPDPNDPGVKAAREHIIEQAAEQPANKTVQKMARQVRKDQAREARRGRR